MYLNLFLFYVALNVTWCFKFLKMCFYSFRNYVFLITTLRMYEVYSFMVLIVLILCLWVFKVVKIMIVYGIFLYKAPESLFCNFFNFLRVLILWLTFRYCVFKILGVKRILRFLFFKNFKIFMILKNLLTTDKSLGSKLSI